jgi:hypothetical protein
MQNMKEMKQFKLLNILSVGVVLMLLASCHNQDQDFPNYEGGSAVYFAYQSPVRTIVLGDDIYDTTLDNEHRFEIYAVMSGVYKNTNKVTIDVAVDNSLVNNLLFEADGDPVVAMPANYYALDGNQIVLDKKIQGAVGVKLNDAFFADPNSLKNTYVVPLVMNSVQGADQILAGTRKETGDPTIDNAPRTNSAGWDVLPKDYVLYAVKFINPWHAKYLRSGVDQITSAAGSSTVSRWKPVENRDIVDVTSAGMMTDVYTVSTTDASGATVSCDLLLTFSADGACTISSQTAGMTASGSGKFVTGGEKLSWGNKDRDALYLDYSVNFGAAQYKTLDTLVVQTRGVVSERFSPAYVN